ncbi:aldo/keto reductase [Streptomyces sp. DSM 44917]|uniref:Aldo/keto reductase n=1 Tax=Streptomyces boetiae TaxID=3075541 RepID=A0ABU2LH10_9ACTN|nr:aldo/keto reductase [Streptomyces sp. DSM 44917]MDT0310448.1 aldo/keto reductase [Streptomyces sp. DSM 44917]
MTAAADLAPRWLGRGLVTHPLGVRCAASSASDDRHVLAALRGAAERGATFPDTSDVHGGGHSERLIGRFLRDFPQGHFRLSSGVGRLRGSAPHPYAGRHIHHQLEQTLENLYADRIDLYVLESLDFGPGDRFLGEAIDQMDMLREVGCIKAIGLRGPCLRTGLSPESRTARAERFRFLFERIRPDVIRDSGDPLLPMLPPAGEDLLAFAARHGVGLLLNARLTDAAPGTPGRLALRYCLHRAAHSVVVLRIPRKELSGEAHDRLEEPLTENELAFIEGLRARARSTQPWSKVSSGTS